jgi:hypothetical protein
MELELCKELPMPFDESQLTPFARSPPGNGEKNIYRSASSR